MSDYPVFSLVILLSGKGSNLQAILQAIAAKQINACVSLVFSDKAHAEGLVIARAAGIKTATLNPADFASRQDYDSALSKLIDNYPADLLILAGYMRILSNSFVEHFKGRLINIHPSLLPDYKGLNTHQRVLDAGEKHHGCSVHFVSAELDGGPVIAQCQFPIRDDDDANSLKNKVKKLEHQLYPKIIQWIVEMRISLQDDELIIAPPITMQELPVL